jgi:Flp pilus assembly protein TadG
MMKADLNSQILSNNSGVAAVEFALIAPLLILLFFGVIELSNLLIADTKLRGANTAVADILTQDVDSVSLTDLQDAAIATQRIMFPLSAVIGTDIATVVDSYSQTAVPAASWSRVLPNSLAVTLGLAVKTSCTDNSRLTNLTLSPVLRAETAYIWRPLFATIFNTTIRLRSVSFFTPRYMSELTMNSALIPYC